MSKDYRQPRQAPKARSSGGGMLLGVFIGFLLGLGVSAAIAIYFFKTPMPFANRLKQPEKAITPSLPEAAKAAKADDGKRRFDFYRILPGQEEPVTDKQLKQEAASAKSGTPAGGVYFLQAGAFQNPADADNLKAKIALMGLEAGVEPTNLAEKGIWYRVRLGPYSSIDEIDRDREQLTKNGVEASLIKIRDAASKN